MNAVPMCVAVPLMSGAEELRHEVDISVSAKG